MLKFLNQNPELAVWVITLLLSVVSILFGFVVKYFSELLQKAKEHGKAISKANYALIGVREENTKNLRAIYSAQKGIWEELTELQRAVAETNLVIGRRKEEINKLREDIRRFNSRLAEQRGLQKQFFISIKNRKAEIDILKSEILTITEDLRIIKTKRD